MRLIVEFLGQARRLAQTREAVLHTEHGSSFRDVLHQIAIDYPALVGPVIVPQTYDIVPAYMVNIDGRRTVRDLDALAEDGQRLILMFVEAGG
jgi:hypothetical protein